MREYRRPYIGHILHRTWTEDSGQAIDGLSLICGQGIAAHLTKPEAYALANRIVDAADKLPDEQTSRPAITAPQNDTSASRTQLRTNMAQSIASAPRARLTAADGTEEPALEATPAENE